MRAAEVSTPQTIKIYLYFTLILNAEIITSFLSLIKMYKKTYYINRFLLYLISPFQLLLLSVFYSKNLFSVYLFLFYPKKLYLSRF